ncbi:ABC transporter permease [Micrococcales bacterium 31B]|nr:ABC transporter permease [Micrococcales bacterium 31B]
MSYLLNNWGDVLSLTGTHLWLSLLPIIIGIVVAIPLGLLVRPVRPLRWLTATAAAIIFTIPSLALFVTLPAVLGTRILDPLNVIVALSLYSAALLVRAVPEALDNVPAAVIDASRGMGVSALRRTLTVELPLALPTLFANLRVIAVTNIAMVSVGSVVGISGLGYLFMRGYQRNYPEQIIAGVVVTLVLALLLDVILMVIGRVLTPWTKAAQ